MTDPTIALKECLNKIGMNADADTSASSVQVFCARVKNCLARCLWNWKLSSKLEPRSTSEHQSEATTALDTGSAATGNTSRTYFRGMSMERRDRNLSAPLNPQT